MIDFPLTDRDFEQALRFLAEKMPDANDLPKPTLLHSIRVGVFLYNQSYPISICIAGLLHDLVEDSGVTIEEIEVMFGKDVSELVSANTKKDNVSYEEFLKDCVLSGESAAIVKAADIMDNLSTYRRNNIDVGVQNMLRFGKILLEIKPETYKDKLFEELEKLFEV